MLQKINHIIFDLGGVILNIDYLLTEKEFIRLGITDFNNYYSQLKQSTLFDNLETGKISENNFIQTIQQGAPVDLTKEEIISAWNAMLLDLPSSRLSLLRQLKLEYNLFLLSNTNIIHEKAFNQIVELETGLPNFDSFFDKVYLSHQIGWRKLEPQAFLLILEENRLNAADTLFIDDSPQHIEAAKKLGLQTIWLQKGMNIETDIFTKK